MKRGDKERKELNSSKFTLTRVLEALGRSSNQQQSRPDQEIPETLRPEHFEVKKTFRHGFPFQPTAVAFDPVQRLLAIGSKSGSLRIPGVDAHAKHDVVNPTTTNLPERLSSLAGMSAASEGAAPAGCGAVLQIQFLVNEGALVTATSDDSLHLWNFKQKAPQIAQTLKFTKERITCMYLPLQSKWLYVGSERGNVHFVNIDSFTLSGYIINWNKAIEVSRKTHPGSIVHLSDNPQDPSKILIGFETGQLVLWDLRLKMAEWRWQSSEPLWSCAWHFEGKQFMCSHADGSLTTWMLRQPKPINVSFPHAKTTKDGKLEPCKAIQKVDWKSSRTGEAYVIFSGGMAYDKAGRTPSITVMHSKTTTVLEMEHTVVDFITLCESPYTSDQQEPYAIVVLLHNDLVVIDLQTAGFPCIENPYPMDIHEAAVTCCSYLADCPADLVPAFYSVGAHNRAGFSKREWPISGGEWPPQSCGYSEIIITGHADGSVKFWDGSAGTLQILYKLKTAKTFEKSRSQSIDGDNEDPFAIQIISLCPESRKLCIAGAAGYVILFTFKRNEESSETTVLEIPIVYEIPEEGDCSPDCEYPPAPSLVSGVKNDNSDNEEKKGNSSVRVKSGVVKKPPGFQAQLVCITPWNQGQPPSQITALAINSSYGLMAYGNEAGIVIVDIVQKVCLLNMGTPDLYGAQDPYSRAPRSPKRGMNSGDALGFGEPPQPQARSPSIDQANKLRLQTTPNEVPTPCPSSPCPPSDTTPLEQSEEAIEDISELPSAIPEEPAQTFQQTRRKSILKNFSLKRQLSKVDMKLKSTFAPPERDKENKRSSSTFYCPNIETSECDVSETVSQIPSLSPIETSDECSTSETVECDAVEELPADIISSDDNNGGSSSQMDSVFKKVENFPSTSDNQITKVSRPDVLELVDEEGKPVPPPRQKFRRSIDKRPMDHRDQRLLSVPNIKFSRQQLQGTDVKDLRRERDPAAVGQPQGQTFAGHLMRRLNKLDNSFSRSRSSSMSSLDNVSSESIQCLVFADSYTKKSDPTMSVATLWVGTSLGSVLTVLLVPPDAESRSSQPVFVSPCGGPMFRLRGAILVISFLDCSGSLIPNSFESWRDENKDKKDRTPTKTNNKMSPTLSESRPSSVEGCGDRQFVVIASVSQARVVALPSQTCIYRNQICETDFIVKADIVTMKDSVCLACYVSSGRMLIFSLPSLRPLLDVDFLPLADLSFQTHCKQGIVDPMLSIWGQQLIVNEDADQIARTFCFSNRGHGLFLSSPSEIQKFTLCTEFCVGLNEMMGELFLSKMEMPEAPKESFIRSWFGGGSRNLDREELFGEASGKPSKSLAKHIPGSGANIQELGQRATTASNEVSRAHKMMVERGEKLSEVEERTQQMMNEAETFQSTAHSVMLKYKDKKWYQL